MEHKLDLVALLGHVDPSYLGYQEWVNVGMALKYEGYTASDWDEWSRRDSGRYRPGECFKKWTTFEGTGNPVTGATITQMAKDNGWLPRSGFDHHELGWEDEISGSAGDYVVIDKNWIEGMEIHEPVDWNPVQQLTTYLSALFEASEQVGYVTDTWKNDEGKYLPTKGNWDRTAGELIQLLNQSGGDIGSVLGDYDPAAGAWIRFNPLDGKGVKNENVTEFRYALVESDTMDIEKQNAVMRELELPIAVMVYSGGKSLHAIVRVEAADYEEYRKRVDYLYNVCKRNGLSVDNQNRNPSRLSRMPGIERNGKKQFIVDTNIGKSTWAEWHEWIEGVNDDLPDPEGLTEFWNDMPKLSPPLIHGLLRQGHKMLMAGPSKAGKSFSLIELVIAIAEGIKWLAWQCERGKVLYVNLELDRASCLHRFKDVYTALDLPGQHIGNIDIWNLRGKSVPMDKLAPKLIRRAQKKNYIAVIIDPIYKVLTGDENSADQMAHFTNQFDKIATELGASVIYCHHHSKGSQGGKKSMDRASGSGVFARDPDALIDLVELELTESLLKQEENKAVCAVYDRLFRQFNTAYLEAHVSQDDLLSKAVMEEHAKRGLASQAAYVQTEIDKALESVRIRSAWRVEGTLREYPKFKPVNMWFQYPIHRVDEVGSLQDIEPEGEQPPYKKATGKRKEKAKEERRTKAEEFEDVVNNCNYGEPPTLNDVMAWYSSTGKEVAERTVRDWIKKFGYEIDRSIGFRIVKKEDGEVI
ncbi:MULTISPECIES: AAA family ATPase [unclassified Paenibacillus]|uniref:AAA family ATPase n=1 Tax=unclassified Paenibacillus TaxID=185978 RepID=UPI002405C489|nr:MULTISPECIES: AAA family ATPase [unclassified Paenibacillus]MDF9845195.1 RecA-family ATPase [Paenibacillus sp. PastF-2]MDF9850313.1 RecA-family ATPase [Paenibacillus sp. PastM-2]MDF9856984.1 RecA-family ATPase [Paenibacillus sp. PastF-1]MDH6482159.1 RecA-family ATPase [Paenibacillus sp. PastH-2]MDH6509677.1 RecA-family ATPase [Paenibacillus sp. PastM-3]